MSNLDNICQKLNTSVDGINLVAIINTDDAKTIAISSDSETSQEQLKDNISSTVMNIFKTSSINKIEKHLSELKGKEIKDPFKEIFISSNTNFYFMRLLDDNGLVIFVISKKTVNQGLIWSEIKRSASELKEKV